MSVRREQLLTTTYETLINVAFMTGSMSELSGLVDKNFMAYGTAANEKIFGFKGLRFIIERQKSQMADQDVKINRSIVSKTMLNDNNAALIIEEFEFKMKDGESVISFTLRMSTLLEYKKSKWVIIHFHGSVPDINTIEGSAWPIEELKRKNIELEKSVNEKTADLQHKNRELEIEASLEKVRAIAMSMGSSKDLVSVCKVMNNELIKLGVDNIRNSQIAINNDDKHFYVNYEYSAYDGGSITDVAYKSHKKVKAMVSKMKGSKNAFFSVKITGKELNEWRRFRIKLGQKKDEKLAKARAICYYFYSVGNGALGISTFNAINKDQQLLLQKFRNVFVLAYKRFTDIQKAEAQTREAQIEVAVERVRAKALAMHKSSDIHEVLRTLRNELFGLDLEGIVGATICLKQANGQIRFWDITDTDATGRYGWDIIVDIGKIDPQLWVSKIWRSKKKIVSCEQDFNDLKRALKWLSKYDKKTAEDILELLKTNNIKHGWNRAVKLAHGRLITDFTNEPPSEIDSILLKIGVAFDLAYQRFLDLQKAEAQAREAQIEAALERVRSRSMAMHKTDELLDAAEIVHKELSALGINSMNVSYAFVSDDEKYGSYYSINPVDGRIVPIPFVFPHTETKEMRSILTSWKKQESVNVIELNEKTTLKHQTYIGQHIQQQLAKNNIPFSVEEFLTVSPKKAVLSTFNFAKGYLFNIGNERLTKTEEDLLLRFTRVFEQTYTRFLDLQKAEAQTREAQIQLSLERVRARAMAMHHSDELSDVLSVLFEQFDVLGINPVFAHLSLFDLEKNLTTLRITGKGGKRSMAQKTVPIDAMDEWKEELNNWKKSKPSSISRIYYKKDILPQIWNLFGDLFDQLPDDSKIYPEDFPDGLYCIQGNTGFGYIGLNHTREATEEEKDIILRFATEFGRVYQRFLDLQKAEAQARESQIEVGLERVRSRAMAMQTSEELNELIGTVFTELTKLDLVLTRCVIWVFDPATNEPRWWMANGEEPSQPMNFLINYHEHPAYLTFLQAWKNQNVRFVYDLKGEDKTSWDDILFNETELVNLPDVVKNGMRAPERVLLSASFNNFGGINVASLEPLSDEHFDILLRFAKVFDLTYTRFNDLKQAEAQARESQIQLALERVRARTMAMQKSDELPETSHLLFQQMKELGETAVQNSIGIVKEDEGVVELSTTIHGHAEPRTIKVPINDMHVMSKAVAAWKLNRKSLTIEFHGQELKEYNELRNSFLETKVNFPEDNWIVNIVFFSKGWLSFSSNHEITKESFQLLERFAAVFDQTYTRFLDLKQAEAQARESQIELGLERVRARAMAMQKSDELSELVDTVFKELTKLDFALTWCIINIIDEPSMSNTVWAANPDINKAPESYHMLFEDYPFHHAMMKGWKERNIKCVYVLEGLEKKVYDEYLFNETEFRRVPSAAQAASRAMEKYVVTFTFSNFGGLQTVGDVPLSDANIDILSRFGKVFDLTYTRFNDLKLAEAQAKEAKIEAALEKVRARTMGMQRSDELPQAASLLFQQIQSLGMPAFATGYCIWDDDKQAITLWMSSEGILQPPFKAPTTEDELFIQMRKGYEEGKSLHVVEMGGEDLVAHYQYMRTLPVVGHIFDSIIKAGHSLPVFQVMHQAYFSKGFLLFITYEPVPAAHDIFKRFASVFDQTYTRFLDLQKAEAQAREAQIETALERVRSRSMAMQKSEELKEVIKIVYQQLIHLKINLDHAGFVVDYTPKGDWTFWIADEQDIPSKITHPYFESVWANQFNEAKEKGADLFVTNLNFEEKNKFYHELLSYVPGLPETSKDFYLSCPGLAATTVLYNNVALYIENFSGIPYSDEDNSILKRFGKVFQQTYTRFLDLQRSEAQTREAQIELALERVRARTMAMHKSEELAETAQVMFHQLQELGGVPDRIAIGIVDEAAGVVNYWTTDQSGSQLDKKFQARLNERTVLSKTYQAWKDQKRSLVVDLHGDDVKEWIKFAREEMGVAVKDEFIKDRRVHSFGFYSHGWILVTTHEPQTAETIQILERFASVFNLTYRRFLDLEKAEAQAHEARIEISLERIRARALAMHKSDELIEVAKVVWEQMTLLGQRELESSVVHLYEEDPDHIHSYRAVSINKDSDAKLTYGHMAIPKNSCDFVREWLEKFHSDLTEYTLELSGSTQQEWYELLFKLAPEVVDSMRQKGDIHEKRYYRFSKFSGGTLLMVSKQEPSEEASYLQKRAAIVFDLAYRRFSDLQKAEAQAREAQIESALEKVRSRSLAMHKSDELQDVVHTVFEKLKELNVDFYTVIILVFQEHSKDVVWWMENKVNQQYPKVLIRYTNNAYFTDLFNAKENGKELLSTCYSGKDKEGLYNYLLQDTDLKHVAADQKKFLLENEFATVSVAIAKNTGIHITSYTKRSFSEQENEILKRFSKVFEQAYIRFMDLQKAEAQAREAQIESALEKVRSRSLAMHKSDELQEVVNTVFERLTELNVEMDSCNIAIFKEGTRDFDFWIASPYQKKTASFRIAGEWNFPIIQHLLAARESGQDFFSECFSFEEKNSWFEFAFANTDFVHIPADRQKYILETKAYALSIAFSKHTGVQVNTYSGHLPSEKEKEILIRFSKVFEQAYIRFLDLERAEAQAREAQIEAALERVRAKAMAMHKSEDLNAAVSVVFDELDKLHLGLLRCGIAILDKEKPRGDIWITVKSETGNTVQVSGDEALDVHPLLHGAYDAWLRQEDFSYVLQEDDLQSYYKSITKTNFLSAITSTFDTERKDQQQYYFNAVFQDGSLFAFLDTAFTDEAKSVMKRFANVFNLTYKRFLDLQKAEANAREALIEAGLERVRSRTMAMHSSDDVSAATATMFTELEKLGIENYRGGITNIFPDRTQEVWSVNNLAEGKVVKAVGAFNIDAHPFWQLMFEKWETKKDFVYYYLAGQDKEEYIKVLNATQGYLPKAIEQFPDVHFQVYFFNEGAVWTNSLHPHSEEEKQIMKRFTSVFSLTFRRYQDLKKAEAQAREATIEAALEKVRGKAMAMHNSNDLTATTSLIIGELRKLGITPIRCGVGIINKETHKAHLYTARTTAEGDSLSVVGWVMLKGHPVLENIYETFVKGEDYFPELIGDSLRSYYEQLLAGLSVPLPDFKDGQKHYGHFFAVSVGCLYAWSDVRYDDDEIKILKRFATIIDLTFRRYFELQKSEANAREAVKQAALDRVRADIASMRTINDLDRITPLIWNELTTLNIPFIRCGVFIMDEGQQLIHTFLSTPDGKAIAAFHLLYDTPGNISKVIENWRLKKIYVDHWGEEEFVQFADILLKQGALSSKEQYLKTIPRGGFKLHFFPFLQGMLYVGNTEQLNEEQIELIQHVAGAFSTAYARYEDFNKLEAAKMQVENTLADLKQAQQQLVQSEKMASLGELTAGIAHEIQNPLNFVNNFSDVSNELLEEMKNELEKGNKEDAIAIVEDVKQNLEKILHHGKRADAIVKGMLQHSRTSSGQKEMTDINSLTDEYLRLAYHGLRAKDKSFNAKFETHFDNNIGKVNVIPQEIGRVILNLINNAFYTVSEKKKHVENGYEPTVTVTTQKDNGKIEIKVKDNGNGIPQKIIDKIFQPFFTTKPTGQGTGLGLSLAYDIITKGHGGELKVETKEGEGSEFIIQLPTN